MTRWFVALSVVLSTAAPALSGVDVEVGNGDRITGTLSPAAETETFRVRVPRGAAIRVKAKSAKKGPALSLHLSDPAAAGAGDAAGKAPSISAVAGESGVFTLTVKSEDGATAGDYSLSISWKSPLRFAASTDLAANAASHLDFAADAGAAVTVSVKPGKGSGATAALESLTGPGAATETLSGAAAQRTLDVTDSYSLAFGNHGAAAGVVTATIKVKPPKPGKNTIALTDAVIGTGSAVFAAVVGAPGGTVTVPPLPPGDPGAAISGSSVTIPPGALVTSTAVVIATAPPITGIGAKTAAGPTVFLGPEGSRFDAIDGAARASVTLPYAPAFDGQTATFVVFTRDAKGKVTAVPQPYTFDHQAFTLTFAASHFSSYVVASDAVPRAPGEIATVAAIADALDICAAFDPTVSPTSPIYVYVAEGQATRVGAIRLPNSAADGEYVHETWAGGGSVTTTPVDRAQFRFTDAVKSVCATTGGVLFAATTTKIYRVDPTTGIVDHVAGAGPIGGAGDGGPALAATFNDIRDMIVDATGGIYVAERGGRRIRYVDLGGTGNVVAWAGSGSGTSGADGAPLATTGIGGLEGLAFAPGGGLYVADVGRIRHLDPVGPVNLTVAGQKLGTGQVSGDGGAPAAARFLTIAGFCTFDDPLTPGHDALALADNLDHTIRLVDLTSATVRLVAGAHGTIGFEGDPGPTPGLFRAPNAVVSMQVRGKHVLFVSDHGNGRIRAITGP